MLLNSFVLGLVKAHFYHIWVQAKILRKTRELRTFYTLLAEVGEGFGRSRMISNSVVYADATASVIGTSSESYR